MMSRHFVSAAASALAGCLLVTANASWAADAAEDPCAGKNPAYCKKDSAPAPAKPKAADCEGRNPLYCKEEPAPAKAAAPEGDNARGRAASDSRNPARNPSPNPNTDPNRKPAHESAEE